MQSWFRMTVALSAMVLVSGCAGVGYILENYTGVEVVQVAMPDDTYRVFDKPSEGKMMVTSSIGAAAGQGIGKGLTLTILDTTPPKPRFQAAAEKFLVDSGRTCVITDGYILITPQFEFKYTCPPPSTAMSKPKR